MYFHVQSADVIFAALLASTGERYVVRESGFLQNHCKICENQIMAVFLNLQDKEICRSG